MKVNSRNLTKPALILLLCSLAVFILALMALSPIALEQAAKTRGVNWSLLSSIGQTYGAVSALLSALALGGVVASLFYQARDVRSSTEQASRTFHFDLLKMEMNDPFYAGIMGAPGIEQDDYDSLRKHNFIHMWVTYWEARYNLHESSDSEVRYIASNELFSSADGRRYWSNVRTIKLAEYKGRLAHFAKIVDKEYQLAIGPISAPENPAADSTSHRKGISPHKARFRSAPVNCIAATAAIIIGLIVRWRLLRRRVRS